MVHVKYRDDKGVYQKRDSVLTESVYLVGAYGKSCDGTFMEKTFTEKLVCVKCALKFIHMNSLKCIKTRKVS